MKHSLSGSPIHRRAFLAGGAGIASLAACAVPAEATELSALETRNLQVVTDFCAAWPSHDLARLLAFFADDGAYRMTETTDLAKGKEAVAARIRSFLDRVQGFEIKESFVRGPMVINERIDRFSGGPLKAWHGVGVFFLRDGQIVDWYDYTIDMERA